MRTKKERAVRYGFFLSLAAVVLLPLTVGGVFSPCTAAKTDEIKVGIPICLTGPGAFAGTKQQKSMQIAIDEINSSNFLGGKKIIPIWGDDESQQSQAITLVKKMATVDEVNAIIGFTLSNIAQAALPIANELKVPTINAGAVAPDLEKGRPYVFRTVIPYHGFVGKMIDVLAKEKNLKRGAILFLQENDVFVTMQKTLREDYRRNGIELVAVESVASGGDADFSTQMVKIASKNPDVLAILVLGGQAGGAMVQARRAGMTVEKTIIVGEMNLTSSEVLRVGGSAAVNTFLPAHWALDSDTEINKRYVKAYRDKYKEDPDVFGTNGYAAMWVFAYAVKGAKDTSRESLVTALNNLGEVPSVFGKGKIKLVNRAAVLEPYIMYVPKPNTMAIYKK